MDQVTKPTDMRLKHRPVREAGYVIAPPEPSNTPRELVKQRGRSYRHRAGELIKCSERGGNGHSNRLGGFCLEESCNLMCDLVHTEHDVCGHVRKGGIVVRVDFTRWSTSLCGGTRAVFEVANMLSERGHRVTITALLGSHAWFPLKVNYVELPRTLFTHCYELYVRVRGDRSDSRISWD